jgi:glutaredoxin-like protein
MSQLLNDDITRQVQEVFADLEQPVTVLFFDDPECEHCAQTKQLTEEVTALSDKLTLETHQVGEELAARYAVSKAPVLLLAGNTNGKMQDFGIRFLGTPGGHEFTSFIYGLLLVSKRDSGLNPATREFLAGLNQPVHLQVFVTPTCPYCPQAVVLAHRMALESEQVTADMVQAGEFMELANHYGVGSVPQTTINAGAGTVIGAYPEPDLVQAIQQALGEDGSP